MFHFLKVWLLAYLSSNLIPGIYSELSESIMDFKWEHTCGDRAFNQPHSHPKYKIGKRMIGGVETSVNNWPFVASIHVSFNSERLHHCGATIISDMHVITAAHCIVAFLDLASEHSLSMLEMRSLIKVNVGRQGSLDMVPEHDVYDIDTLDYHIGFNFTGVTYDHDIMVLKLSRKISFSRQDVNMACLPDQSQMKSLQPGFTVFAFGWGSTEARFDYTYAKNLHMTSLTILDAGDPECNSGLVGMLKWDKQHFLCAAGNKKVPCFGDSGGPVLQFIDNRWTLVGIISFANDIIDYDTGKRKCDPSKASYFVNVTKYLDWINQAVNYL